MKFHSFRHWLGVGIVCAGSLSVTTGCVDSDYDLNKVDLTMGLGGEGLSVKLGNTEKIFLSNILEPDETVKLDGNNLYYLVKDGQTDFHIRVDEVSTNIHKTTILNNHIALDYEDVRRQLQEQGLDSPGQEELSVPAGFCPIGHADGSMSVKVDVEVPHDINEVKSATVQRKPVAIKINLKCTGDAKFSIDRIKNVEISVPKFMKINEVSEGWTIDGQTLKLTGEKKINAYDHEFCRIVITDVDLEGSNINKATDELDLPEDMTKASVKGDVFFKADQNFIMRENDFADVDFVIETVDESDLKVESVTCRINPEISPDEERIEVSGELPDFLKDEAVQVNVSNSTIKIDAQLEQIPVGVHIGGTLTSDTYTGSVTLPQVTADEQGITTIYYYEGEKPYDPEGAKPEGGTVKYQNVNNVGKLIEKLPEAIHVNMQHGQIAVQDKLYTVNTGRDYRAAARYEVYVPFEFSNGFTIVYNDSTNSMKDDLEDYAAEGVRVSATIVNTIPLGLVATMMAVDEYGHPIPGISFTQVEVPASAGEATPSATEVNIDATLSDPYLLPLVDRLIFKINAAAGQSASTHKLYSTQYIEVKDIKLRLKGKIIANLN